MDFDPETDGDEVEWARSLDEQGWRTGHDTGVWQVFNGRRVKRWSLRRRKPKKAGIPGSGRPLGAIDTSAVPGIS